MLCYVLAMLLLAGAEGCVYPYGSRKEAKDKGTHFEYNFAGNDWGDKFPACKGKRQSPLLLHVHDRAPAAMNPAYAASFKYGTLDSSKLLLQILNNGHTVQLQWPATFTGDVTLAVPATGNSSLASTLSATGTKVKRVRARPAQLHFHARSEHVIDGHTYPLEMHIVHIVPKSEVPSCPDSGCLAVLGIMFKLTDRESESIKALDTIINLAPMDEKVTVNITAGTKINLDSLVPKNRAYVTYEGSLTAPPCLEGVMWHVMTTPMPITNKQLLRIMEAMGDTYCPDTEDNDRRRLLALQPQSWKKPSPFKDGCWKMSNANNFRDVQPVNSRMIKMVKA